MKYNGFVWFVAGYLQQEKLLATCREFILESSDLKEYAEHCTEDGFIPACLLVSLCSLNSKVNCVLPVEENVRFSSVTVASEMMFKMMSLIIRFIFCIQQG